MKREVAEKIVLENRETYNKVATEFSRTRAGFWSELAYLAEHATPGMRVIDIGCGNGRLYPLLTPRSVAYTGVDFSAGLLAEARQKNPGIHVVEANATELPFADHSFDIAFSFATIHHIPSDALRVEFIREVSRVLNHGSTFILTAWDLWQPAHFSALLFSLLRRINPFATLDAHDIWLTFGAKKERRYLHAFSKRELIKLLSENGFEVIDTDIVVRASGSGQKNILVVAKKK